ncbi:NAD-dependent succinate-semialdehyde dehydrogenase [Corynebacterium sanguinis]|uniref:NAD-dependent succinate-semialdehyde dehydrogenase n=1 Tax=Corynebacterium sanguinis TaxID=2594913 RepID=A0A6C1TZ25_9CORY|nr:NAD-dependent succinate-semialdehyde dehydrogenase [Corynebacterium sanguinis]MCT1614790.1 NAD-dependent succinate-semialdehyde dehydrogenase [Corynebacterium sanguinis]MCT1883554.1 NAD-dependent succinate-semialdehyde dehydrogenase [Corynebacterium sanguinis]MDN8622569.1 NAD-dependent succinate-semialdehyde dehydrogenase [Corynebacterium sanguinis]TVS24467.1 NAD-dependent succinate-semialdehyde dehydrogenase [Corynebacterium sanguinis]TVS29835.1 NAD-dependent succinate-semialdehyde dehydro
MTSTYRVQNPKTNKVVETFETISDADLERALTTADEAFSTWRETPLEERAAVLRKVASLFDAQRDELSKIIAEEMGKSLREGDNEVDDVVDIFGYYADHGAELLADEPLETEGGSAVMRKVPLGVIVGVMPWNYPYYQVARFAAPTLMAGNTVLLKHAEICARSSQKIQEILEEAGAPAGVFTNVYASHDQITTLIEDPRVQGVSLTGSERAGRAVAATAGKNLKKALLELGGTDPYIILDTDDVAAAAKTAWKKRMSNVGQACTSNKRIIVMEDIYDDFVAEMVRIAESFDQGDPMNPQKGEYYPMSSRDAAETLDEQVKKAVEEGATLHTGGELAEGSAYYSPAVITGIPVGSEAYYEEFFGPVAEIYSVADEEEAIKLANDSQYGLGGAVFSTDEERAKRVANQVVTGMIHVNIPQARGAELPFGGVKNSGFGRELGPLGIDEFVNRQRFFVADES